MSVATVDLATLAGEVQRVAGLDKTPDLTFLARGEYSINYYLDTDNGPLVARLVTGSQIGLSLPEQVRYEARALELLEPSGRTPRCIEVSDRPEGIPYPFLIETYLPGAPLDYRADLDGGARCIADIHQVPVPDDHGLQLHRNPGPSIFEESQQWSERYLGWGSGPRDSRRALEQGFAIIGDELDAIEEIFAEPDLVLVNYDVNTHNFIVRPDDRFVSLIDWEKARIAPAVQDLAHFLLPTTTLWRTATATRLTDSEEARFVSTYLDSRPGLDAERFGEQLAVMKRLIALRAVSWCSWARWAAATGSRAITNQETLDRCVEYLEPSFLASLFRTG